MRTLIALAVLGFTLAAPSTAAAQSEEWFGTWRLNLEASVYNPGPPPYRRGTMEVEPWGEDGIKFVYDLVRLRGGVQHMEWSGRFDGRDYMVQGADEYITYSYRPVDERTFEVVTKLDQQVAAVSTVTLSPDGRRLTTVTGGRNASGQEIVNTTVYEKVD